METMLLVRKSQDRGYFDFGWLKTHHSFSFADYYDPQFMGYSVLRVLNEDTVARGQGFGKHPHRDMEIVTYVIQGALAHEDSMGNGSTILPGDVQYMSAGTGVTHSEFNHSQNTDTHLLQIWILPDKHGYPPAYGQKSFPEKEKLNHLKLVASGDGRDGSLSIRQDINLYACILENTKITPPQRTGRHFWLQLISGELQVGPEKITAGDAAYGDLNSVPEILNLAPRSEFLLFDLP